MEVMVVDEQRQEKKSERTAREGELYDPSAER